MIPNINAARIDFAEDGIIKLRGCDLDLKTLNGPLVRMTLKDLKMSLPAYIQPADKISLEAMKLELCRAIDHEIAYQK